MFWLRNKKINFHLLIYVLPFQNKMETAKSCLTMLCLTVLNIKQNLFPHPNSSRRTTGSVNNSLNSSFIISSFSKQKKKEEIMIFMNDKSLIPTKKDFK